MTRLQSPCGMTSMFKHYSKITRGKRGEISKINEELEELSDAYSNSSKIHQIIECSDIIESVGQLTRKQYKIPLCIMLFLVYLRSPYKIVRNKILDILDKPKRF